jgi:transcriptional regulator with XRE-family HTH domain
MTQQTLAEAVGIKFQQIQKYETGANRVSASRLWDIAEALGCSVVFFFEGLESSTEDDLTSFAPDKDTVGLLRILCTLPRGQREAIRQMAESMAPDQDQCPQLAG